MQDAIQSQKKIEESLYNFGCDHTGGKMHGCSQKLFIWKEKAYFSEQNLAIWEQRGGVAGRQPLGLSALCLRDTPGMSNCPTLFLVCVGVCVCVCEKAVVSWLTGCCLCSCFDLKMMRKKFWCWSDTHIHTHTHTHTHTHIDFAWFNLYAASWVNWITLGDKCGRNQTDLSLKYLLGKYLCCDHLNFSVLIVPMWKTPPIWKPVMLYLSTTSTTTTKKRLNKSLDKHVH